MVDDRSILDFNRVEIYGCILVMCLRPKTTRDHAYGRLSIVREYLAAALSTSSHSFRTCSSCRAKDPRSRVRGLEALSREVESF